MLSAKIGDMILTGGMISQIKYNGDKVYVCFHGATEDMTYEFRNGKRPRADHVRKLNLKEGENVLASGGRSKLSSAYAYGWDISRDGTVGNKEYGLIYGHVRKIMRPHKPNSPAVFVIDPQGIEIKIPSRLSQGIREADDIICLCYAYTKSECLSPCKKGITNKCAFCRKKTAKKRYIGLAIEKEENNGNCQQIKE